LDSQEILGDDLGYTAQGTDEGKGALDAILLGKPFEPMRNVRPNLDVVPAGEYTDDLATMLDGRRGRRDEAEILEALAVSLAPVANDYEVTLIDCPPKIPVLQELALTAARYLLIPTKSDASSRKAMAKIGERYLAAKQYNPDLELLGVVLFGSNSSATALRKQTLAEIAADLDSDAPLFDTVIRHVEATATKARNSGRLVHELEQAAKDQEPWYKRLKNETTDESEGRIGQSVHGLAADYQSLASELVARLAAAANSQEVAQ
jgi:cellulose biosynthesis protein BcsQ